MTVKLVVCLSSAVRTSVLARPLPFFRHKNKVTFGVSPTVICSHEAAVCPLLKLSSQWVLPSPAARLRTRHDITSTRLGARRLVRIKEVLQNFPGEKNAPKAKFSFSSFISSSASNTRVRDIVKTGAKLKRAEATGVIAASLPAYYKHDTDSMRRTYIMHHAPSLTLKRFSSSYTAHCKASSLIPPPVAHFPSSFCCTNAREEVQTSNCLPSHRLFPAATRAHLLKKRESWRYYLGPSLRHAGKARHGNSFSPMSNTSFLSSSSVLSTPLVCRFQQQLSRCLTYMEARGKMTAAQTMTDPVDILNFFVANADASTALLSTCLRRIASTSSEGKLKEIIKDERFQQLVRLLEARVDDCDARMLTQLCQALYSFRNHTEAIAELARRVSSVIVRRENAFSPKNVASLVFAFSWLRLGEDALALHEFLLAEAMKLLAEMEPTDVVTLLEGFRRMRVGSKETTNVLLEKLTDDVDRFTSKDVVALLKAMSSAGTARGFLLRRVATLAFDNLETFQPRQLSSILCSLTRLRFASVQNCDQLFSLLRPSLETLPPAALYEILEALTLVSFPQVAAVNECIDHLWKAADKDNMALTYAVAIVYAILQFQLHDKTDMAKQLLLAICQRPPPEGKLNNLKMMEIIAAVDIEQTCPKVEVPPQWRAAVDQAQEQVSLSYEQLRRSERNTGETLFSSRQGSSNNSIITPASADTRTSIHLRAGVSKDRRELERLEGSGLHNEVMLLLDSLRGKYQLQIQRNQQAGPYWAEFLDEETKICLDIDSVYSPTTRSLKFRHLKMLGYHPILIDSWQWRRLRSEADQIIFLKQQLSPPLIELDRLDSDILG